MAIIKTLKDFLTKATLYPITKTQAVYDDTVGRLDSYLQNTLGAEPIDNTDEESTDLIDADTLGGRYTAEDLDAMPKSTAIEDYANIEPPITDADRLGGKYTAKDIEQEFAKLNSSLGSLYEPELLTSGSLAKNVSNVSVLVANLNSYRLLYIESGFDTAKWNPTIIPISILKDGEDHVSVGYYRNTSWAIFVKYKSDTELLLGTGGTQTGDTYYKIYGLK